MHVPDLSRLGLKLNMDFIRERDETAPASHGGSARVVLAG